MVQQLVETDKGEWEDTLVTLDISTTQVNPLASLTTTYTEDKQQSLPVQSPVKLPQLTLG